MAQPVSSTPLGRRSALIATATTVSVAPTLVAGPASVVWHSVRQVLAVWNTIVVVLPVAETEATIPRRMTVSWRKSE